MAVDLSDLIPSLKREVNPPGEDLFPDATTAEWLGNLSDGFWECVIDGIIKGYDEEDGAVSPSSGTTDLPRDLQQVVVIYAGIRIVRNQLRSIKTTARYQAGPVSYETQQSASVMRGLLNELNTRRNTLLNRLSDMGFVDSYVIDSISARDESLYWGDTYFLGPRGREVGRRNY